MSIWWCNQRKCSLQERQAGVVCASDTKSNAYRKTVGEARAGDIIVHYRRPHVVAFSRALESGMGHDHLPLVAGVNYGRGWRFETDYWDLQNPIADDDFRAALTPAVRPPHYAIKMDGRVMQGYFLPFDEAGLLVVLNHVHLPFPPWLQQFIA